MAPAARNLATAGASASGRRSLSAGAPTLAVNPTTLNASLTLIGSPSSARPSPRAMRRSESFAAAAAAAGVERDQRIDPRIDRLDPRQRLGDEVGAGDLARQQFAAIRGRRQEKQVSP